MKVWRIQYGYDDSGSGIKQEWHASKDAANKALRLNGGPDSEGCGVYDAIECIDISPGKIALLRFLNRFADMG